MKDLLSKLYDARDSITQAIEGFEELASDESIADHTPIARIPLLGDRGDHVKQLQERLNELDNAGLSVDGVFGPLTEKAIQNFQRKNGLPGGGIIGEITLDFLKFELVSPFANGVDLRKDIWNTAYAEIGVKSILGHQHHPRILEYHSTTGGFSDDETPWCSSFVQWVLKQNGVGGTGSAAARSWMNWGTKTTHPKQGDIVVFWRVAVNSWQGHVGFYSHEDATHIHVLGGNQSRAVNIQRYAKTRLLGYRTYV